MCRKYLNDLLRYYFWKSFYTANMKSLKKFFKNFVLALHIFFMIAMVGLGILSFTSPDIIRAVLDWIGEQIRSWGNWNYLILFFVAMIESFPFIWVVVPWMNIMILVWGFFVHRNFEVFLPAVLLAMLGASLGNALGYMMGRYAGKELLQKYGMYIGLGARELTFLEKQVKKNGFWFIVGGKFHNLLRSFVPYLAASQGFSGKRFWIANIIGSSIWAASLLLIGMFFVESYEVILQYFSYILIVVIIIAFGVYYYRERKNNPWIWK